jgi:hypothetical protein
MRTTVRRAERRQGHRLARDARLLACQRNPQGVFDHVGQLSGPAPYGLSDLVLSGFVRIVTHPRVFVDPTPLAEALAFVRSIRDRENRVAVEPGPRHWEIFLDLCERVGVRGNLVPDAYLAALAIEAGMEWVTTDGDFRRFPGLKVRHPLG